MNNLFNRLTVFNNRNALIMKGTTLICTKKPCFNAVTLSGEARSYINLINSNTNFVIN